MIWVALLGWLLAFMFWLSGVMSEMTWFEDVWEDANGDIHEYNFYQKMFKIMTWPINVWRSWSWGKDWILVFQNVWFMIKGDSKSD